jgi:hypothetical protein
MYVLKGRKRWRMVASGGLESCYISSQGAGPSVQEGGDTIGGSLIDLFSPDETLEAALGGSDTVLYEGEIGETDRNQTFLLPPVHFNAQESHHKQGKHRAAAELKRDLFVSLGPGEMIFTPSKCAHAVQNLSLTIALTSNYVDLSNVMDVYDSLSGVHPNGNPLPPFHPCAEEVLALCVPRAMQMIAAVCDEEEAARLQHLLRSVLRQACERRAALLVQRLAVMRRLAAGLEDDRAGAAKDGGSISSGEEDSESESESESDVEKDADADAEEVGEESSGARCLRCKDDPSSYLPTDHDGYTCDGCGTSIPPGCTYRYMCKHCKRDLCEPCSQHAFLAAFAGGVRAAKEQSSAAV